MGVFERKTDFKQMAPRFSCSVEWPEPKLNPQLERFSTANLLEGAWILNMLVSCFCSATQSRLAMGNSEQDGITKTGFI